MVVNSIRRDVFRSRRFPGGRELRLQDLKNAGLPGIHYDLVPLKIRRWSLRFDCRHCRLLSPDDTMQRLALLFPFYLQARVATLMSRSIRWLNFGATLTHT